MIAAPAGPPSLNQAQIATLRLLAEGLSNRKIARRLEVAEETVKTRVRLLLDRAEVSNRTELLVWALRKGLVPCPCGRDQG